IGPLAVSNSHGLTIAYDSPRPHPAFPRLQQHGCAVRPFHEDRVPPADVDVVDLQVLTERDSSRKQRRHDDPEHEAHPANTHIRASIDLCGGRSLRIAGNLTPTYRFDYFAVTRL